MTSEIIQLDLFIEPPTKMETMQLEIAHIIQKQDNLRRGIFARHSDLMKTIVIMQNEMDELKSMLCKKDD